MSLGRQVDALEVGVGKEQDPVFSPVVRIGELRDQRVVVGGFSRRILLTLSLFLLRFELL